MKAFRKTISWLLILTCIFQLFGCGKDATGENDLVSKTPSSGEAEDPVTINWLSFRGDDVQINDKLIKKFEYENPDVKVLNHTMKDETEYYRELDARIASGAELDVFQTHTSSYMVKLGKDGILEDLTNCLFTKNVFENILPITTIDGKVCAMLQSVNLILVYYNKSIFERYGLGIPDSFNELKETVKTLKDHGEGGIAYPGKTVNSEWATNIVLFPQIAPEGFVEMYDGLCSGKTTSLHDIPGMLNTCYILSDICESRLLYENSREIDINKACALFAQAKASMMIMGTWKIGTAAKEFPNIDFGVFPFPVNEKTNAAYGEAGQATAIYSKSKNIDAAKRFMEFLFSPEVESIYCTETKQTPTIKGVKASYDLQYLVTDVMEKGFYILQPAGNDQFDVYHDLLKKSLDNVLFNGSDVEDEIDALESKLKKK